MTTPTSASAAAKRRRTVLAGVRVADEQTQADGFR